ncbi:N-acetylmuramoyl-L-alanine amidase [Novosphingobium olei]|uniref:N-acetylmuramoyl-L-alanine amidase n=1 Tax=Novosphingobium olei TaxID=2728851 RepID=A0A7Y0G9F6_9SPHN|nr:N-acetylmuramoyl-L-alanine amidase [Novosphingobium olei]NML92993.1 N-acetylmuramoyl-L-alanine amidase [Novosphingobium olei]BEU99562.1 N-acetylmuramoyl-L-alanine amidase [Novosphingobium olei]
MNRWLIHRDVASPNWNERKLPVTMVVLHYTGMQSAAEALERMCDPAAEVSAHYMIDEDGTVTRLVPEEKRAWHAGRSYWRGVTDVNSASVGIELVNPGHEWGYRPFPDAQMEALAPLLADIVKRHNVPRANVVGHSDIAPARKTDPGELFDWDMLARLRLALPKPKLKMRLLFDNDGAFFLALERFGYDISDPAAAVRAFERRWRPHRITGEIDGQLGALLFELLLERDMGHAR